MAGAKEEDLAEDVSGIMGSQDTLVIAHSNGVFHHHIQWCACPGSAPYHIQLFRHGLFLASVIHPKTAFTFDVLDHFYMDAMEFKTAGWSFFQKLRRFTNNAAQHLFLLVFITHQSLWSAYLWDHLEPV